jgi:alginate O-acetyltransferase complex protein AlgI
MDILFLKETSIRSIGQLLTYDPSNPLLFNSGLFLFLFLFFLMIYTALQHKTKWRVIFIVLFSIYFYYKSSGYYFILMLYTSTIAHYVTLYIYNCSSLKRKKITLVISLVFYLGILLYFKYSNFFIGLANNFLTKPLSVGALFIPLGISFYTFELISYTVDVYKNKIKPVESLLDFCFYVSFFPHLVAGPIVRPSELIPQIYSKLAISKNDIGKGVFLITAGLFKKAIISDYISSNFVDRIFDNPGLYSGIENLLAVYGYSLQIYCDFSGYSDMAIGIALLIGYHLPVNFNAPYRSASLSEFWRRWHISLSAWLRDYLYIPLGGNRSGRLRQYFNLFITMLLGGLWHGASLKFVFWGALHGLGLAIEKGFRSVFNPRKSLLLTLAGIFITFNFVSFCWIFFRASSLEAALQVLHQILYSFNYKLLIPVITGYKIVFIICIAGYLLHIIPQRIDVQITAVITKTPFFVKAALLASVIWLVIQTKSAGIQPFIYFQF